MIQNTQYKLKLGEKTSEMHYKIALYAIGTFLNAVASKYLRSDFRYEMALM